MLESKCLALVNGSRPHTFLGRNPEPRVPLIESCVPPPIHPEFGEQSVKAFRFRHHSLRIFVEYALYTFHSARVGSTKLRVSRPALRLKVMIDLSLGPCASPHCQVLLTEKGESSNQFPFTLVSLYETRLLITIYSIFTPRSQNEVSPEKNLRRDSHTLLWREPMIVCISK